MTENTVIENTGDDSRVLAGGAVLRPARPGDENGILDCIRLLAEYEREQDAVQATAAELRRMARTTPF